MIEKIRRPQQYKNQEMQIPRNIQELMQRYDLDNTDIRDYLDIIAEYIEILHNSTEVNILKACLTTDNTMLTSTGNYSTKEFPMSETVKIGTKLSFSNNAIVIGQGVNHIKISAKVVAVNPNRTTLCGIRITKNSEELSSCFENNATNWSYKTFECTKETVKVSAGDKIRLGYYFNGIDDTVTIKQYGQSTFLEVEVVD